MITGSIARRYARALLGIGVAAGQSDELGAELAPVAQLMKNKELGAVLENPSVALSRRQAIVQQLLERLQVGKAIRSLVLLLLQRGRISALPDIAREYGLLCDEHAGRVRVEVASAVALDEQGVSRLREALERKTGKRVIVEQRTDPDLIAGIVTKIGSVVYDGSMRARLDQMRQALLNNPS